MRARIENGAGFGIIHSNMQPYIPISSSKAQADMAQRVRIKASEGHRGFGKLLKRVYDTAEHLIIERAGDPVAVMMSYQEYEQYRRQQALAAHRELVKKVGAEAEKQGLTEEQLIEEMRQTRKKLFKEHYGHHFDQA